MASRNIDSGKAQKLANKLSGREIEAAYDSYVSTVRRAIRQERYPSHDPSILTELRGRVMGMRVALSLLGFGDDLLEDIE